MKTFRAFAFAVGLFLNALLANSLHFNAARAEPAKPAEPVCVAADGSLLPGKLVGVDAHDGLTLASTENQQTIKRQTIALNNVAWWGRCAEIRKGPVALLADGGVLRGDVVSANGGSVQLDCDSIGVVKVSCEQLVGLVFHPPACLADRDQLFDRIWQLRGEGDRLLLDNGDEVSGRLESIEGDKIRIQSRLGPLDLSSQKAIAFVSNPALRQTPPAARSGCWIGMSDGSRLLASELHSKGTALAWKNSLGQSWKTDVSDVVFFMPRDSRTQYLSDMPPLEYHFLPFLSVEWPYRVDRNVTDGMLRCGGRLYLKGIGVHSAARLSYQLDKPWKEFLAEVGVDDSTGGRGSVGFRVFVDGVVKFSSGPVRGGMSPKPVRVDLTGAKRIDLVVDYGEQGDVLDHADWLNARLTPK